VKRVSTQVVKLVVFVSFHLGFVSETKWDSRAFDKAHEGTLVGRQPLSILVHSRNRHHAIYLVKGQ
jgi:hypothetical protein